MRMQGEFARVQEKCLGWRLSPSHVELEGHRVVRVRHRRVNSHKVELEGHWVVRMRHRRVNSHTS